MWSSLRTHLSQQMTPTDLRKIHTTEALKLQQYFYLLMEKSLGCYFQIQSRYCQAAQCNQKTPIPVSSRWQVRSEKAKKGWASTKYKVAPSSTQPFILSRLIKWVPGISGNLVVKSKLPPQSGTSLEGSWIPSIKRGDKVFFII